MAQLIDKDALVAEIDDWRHNIMTGIATLHGRQRVDAAFEHEILGIVRDFIDTLEVIEICVDLGDHKGDKSAKHIIDTKTLEVKEVDDEPECKIFPRPAECYSTCKECPWSAASNKAHKGKKVWNYKK